MLHGCFRYGFVVGLVDSYGPVIVLGTDLAVVTGHDADVKY